MPPMSCCCMESPNVTTTTQILKVYHNFWRFYAKPWTVAWSIADPTTVPWTLVPCAHTVEFVHCPSLNNKPWMTTSRKLSSKGTFIHQFVPPQQGSSLLRKRRTLARIDYWDLNQITVKYYCPLLLVPSALEQLRSAKVFTNLCSAEHTVLIKQGEERKIAFSITALHYEYSLHRWHPDLLTFLWQPCYSCQKSVFQTTLRVRSMSFMFPLSHSWDYQSGGHVSGWGQAFCYSWAAYREQLRSFCASLAMLAFKGGLFVNPAPLLPISWLSKKGP